MTEPDALSAKPARRTARRRLLVLGSAGLAALLVIAGVVKYRQSTAPLRPALFVQTPGTLDTIQFTRDGRLLMTTEGDASNPMVTFRDADTGQIVRQWPGGAGQKWLSEDGTRFLEQDDSLHGPGHCILRDALTGRVLRQWTGQIGSVRPDFSLLITADSVRLIPRPPGSPLGRSKKFGPQDFIRPKVGRVVEVETGRVVGQFPLGSSILYFGDCSLSSVKPLLYQTGYGQPARLLRLPSMTPLLTGLPPLRSLRVTWDRTRVIGIDNKGVLHFWSLPSGQHTTVATGLSYAFWASSLKNGELIVDGTQGQYPHSNPVIQVRSADGTHVLHSFSGMPLAFSPDMRLMAVDVYNGPSDDMTCAIWNLETGQRQALLDVGTDAQGNPASDRNFINGSWAIGPDGRQFVFAAKSGLLRFYRPGKPSPVAPSSRISTDSGRTVLSFGTGSGYSPGISDAIVLPGGGVAATGGQDMSSDDRRVQIWQPGQDAWWVKAVVGNGSVEKLGVSPDGTQIVGSSQWGLWMLDLKTRVSTATPIQSLGGGRQGFSQYGVGQPVWLDGPGQPVTVVFMGDYTDGSIWLTRWDSAGQFLDKKKVVPVNETRGRRTFKVAEAEVSPNGRMLAVSWSDTMSQGAAGAAILELRETRTGRVLRTLTAPLKAGSLYARSSGACGHPTFSLDGKRLAAADDIGGISVWDTETGSLLGRLSGTESDSHTHTFFSTASGVSGGMIRTAFAPDNQHLAVGREDGSIYLYSLNTWLPVAELGQTALWTGTPEQVHLPLRWLSFAPDGHTLYGDTVNGADVLSWPVPALKDNF